MVFIERQSQESGGFAARIHQQIDLNSNNTTFTFACSCLPILVRPSHLEGKSKTLIGPLKGLLIRKSAPLQDPKPFLGKVGPEIQRHKDTFGCAKDIVKKLTQILIAFFTQINTLNIFDLCSKHTCRPRSSLTANLPSERVVMSEGRLNLFPGSIVLIFRPL